MKFSQRISRSLTSAKPKPQPPKTPAEQAQQTLTDALATSKTLPDDEKSVYLKPILTDTLGVIIRDTAAFLIDNSTQLHQRGQITDEQHQQQVDSLLDQVNDTYKPIETPPTS